ncbi:hypothetical protein IV102_25020 [bacterium]|nr:hypothetical protein [bacterium]
MSAEAEGMQIRDHSSRATPPLKRPQLSAIPTEPKDGLGPPIEPQPSDVRAKIGACLALTSVPAGLGTAWLAMSQNADMLVGVSLPVLVAGALLVAGLTLVGGQTDSGSDWVANPANPGSPLYPRV